MALFFNKKIVPIFPLVSFVLLESFSTEIEVKRWTDLIIFHLRCDKFSELHLAYQCVQ